MIRDLMLIGVTELAGSATTWSLGVERKTESKLKLLPLKNELWRRLEAF